MNHDNTIRFGNGAKVRFTSGEHTGKVGTVQSCIPMYLKGERLTYRITLDGFPIRGGWDGRVFGHNDTIERVA